MNHPVIRNVAIIGSGLAGLTTAIGLREGGIRCSLFEKSRGPGGRMSSKRLDQGSLDLGAQFFTARDDRFRAFLDQYVTAQGYAAWDADFRFERADGELASFHKAERFVGVPRMSALTRSLSRALTGPAAGEPASVSVHHGCRIIRVSRDSGQWYLFSDGLQQYGPFDGLCVTAPPAQAAHLMKGHPEIEREIMAYRMEPCWAVACGYDQPLALDFDAVRSRHPVLGWAARDSAKPQRRSDREWWVLHAQGDWSWDHRDDHVDQVIAELSGAFQSRFGINAQPAESLAHRWLYAKPVNDSGPGFLSYDDLALGFCGDWLNGGRVEGAFLSASDLLAHWRQERRIGH